MSASYNSWPNWTCVAAFVEAAVEAATLTPIQCSRAGLAQRLGIKVPHSCHENPYDLPLTDTVESAGLSLTDAKLAINEVLGDYAPDLAFRHVPLNEIPFAMYEEVLSEATKRQLVVGLGFDYGYLSGSCTITRHLARIVSYSDDAIALFDDSKSAPLPLRSLPFWLRACRAINDGFWMIGTRERLQLSYV